VDLRHILDSAVIRDEIQLAHLDLDTLNPDGLEHDLSKILLFVERIRHVNQEGFPASSLPGPIAS
jgi:hypothetical protein